MYRLDLVYTKNSGNHANQVPRAVARCTHLREEAREMTRTHTFTLLFSGVDLCAPGVEDQLFEAGCDDAVFGTRGAMLFAEFDREASSLVKAVISAMSDLENAITGLTVVRIEPDDLVRSRRSQSGPGARTNRCDCLSKGAAGGAGSPGRWQSSISERASGAG